MICERCKQDKRGVEEVEVLDQKMKVCLRCRRRIDNLLELWCHAKKESYREHIRMLIYQSKLTN